MTDRKSESNVSQPLERRTPTDGTPTKQGPSTPQETTLRNVKAPEHHPPADLFQKPGEKKSVSPKEKWPSKQSPLEGNIREEPAPPKPTPADKKSSKKPAPPPAPQPAAKPVAKPAEPKPEPQKPTPPKQPQPPPKEKPAPQPAKPAPVQEQQELLSSTKKVTPLGLSQEYFDRVEAETEAFENVRHIESHLQEDFKSMLHQLHEELDAPDQEGHAEKIRKTLDDLADRFTEYDKKIATYNQIELRGPWDVSGDIRKALDALHQRTKAAERDLRALSADHFKFTGNGEPDLKRSKGLVAKWLNTVGSKLNAKVEEVNANLDSHKLILHTEFAEQGKILTDLTQIVAQLVGRQHVTTDDIAKLTQRIRTFDDRSTAYRSQFLKMIQEKVAAEVNMGPTETRLDNLKKQLDEVRDKVAEKVEETGQGLHEIKTELDQVKTSVENHPYYDTKLVQSIHGLCDKLAMRKDQTPTIKGIQATVEELKERPDLSEDTKKRLSHIEEDLKGIRHAVENPSENLELASIRGAVMHIEKSVEHLDAKPSQDYTEKLEGLNKMLEDAKQRAEDERATLEDVKKISEELKLRPKVDDTEALRNIEKSLDKIKNTPQSTAFDYGPALQSITDKVNDAISRPALNSPFNDLVTDVSALRDAVGTHDKTVATLLQSLDKELHDRPGLNIDRDELFNRLKAVEHMLEARPAVNQKDLFTLVNAIKRKSDSIDFPGTFSDLNRLDSRLTGLINRPYLTPNDVRQQIQGIHDNLDDLKKNPVLKSNRPLLTHEHFENTMRPVAESVLGLTSRPIDKSVLEVVQNIQSGVAQVIERPKFDVRPITSINRMIEANHKADNARYNALVAKIDGVHVDDGGMKTRLDEIEERVNEQLNGVTQKQDSVSKDVSNKLDMLTKITGGVAIAGGALTLGFLGYKLLKAITGGGNKEEGGRSPARAKVNKRIHARSWGGRNEPLNARSIWDDDTNNLDDQSLWDSLMEMDAAGIFQDEER